MLGLAMVAAIVAMAFIGAGTASAELCKVNSGGSACPAGSKWNTPTTLLYSSPKVKLTASFATVICASHVTAVHEGVKAGKLFGTFTKMEWSGCSGCTTVETTGLGEFEDEKTGLNDGNGKLFPKNVTILLKNCPFGAECTATATSGTTMLSLKGGSVNGTGNAEANTTVTVAGGFACGTKGTWVTETPYTLLLIKDSTGDYTTGQSVFQV